MSTKLVIVWDDVDFEFEDLESYENRKVKLKQTVTPILVHSATEAIATLQIMYDRGIRCVPFGGDIIEMIEERKRGLSALHLNAEEIESQISKQMSWLLLHNYEYEKRVNTFKGNRTI